MTIMGTLLVAVLLSAAACAAPPAHVKPKFDLTEMLAKRGLMHALNASMLGEPVIAVGSWDSPEKTEAPASADHKVKLLTRLQGLCDWASAKDDALIPWEISGAMVIAPETRDDVDTEVSGLTSRDVVPRTTLFDAFLVGLTAGQVRQAGTEEGLAIRSLSRDAQNLLTRALRPPLSIMNSTAISDSGIATPAEAAAPTTAGAPPEPSPTPTGSNVEVIEGSDIVTTTRTGPDGSSTTTTMGSGGARLDDAGALDDSVDWSGSHLRLRLAIGSIQISDGKSIFTSLSTQRGAHTELRPAHGEADPSDTSALPVLKPVSNTFKPSDLEGRSLSAPAGLQGVHLLADVLKTVSKATHLRLTAQPSYQIQPVFIGSPSITCGQIVDGLRLGCRGAWRRVGDTYVLGWDKRGLAALQLLVQENGAGVTKQAAVDAAKVNSDPGWLTVVDNSIFDPADPFALTPEQRTRLLESDKFPDGSSNLKFAEMTSEQQDAVRSLAHGQFVTPVGDPPGAPRPITDEDLQQVDFGSQIGLTASVDVPGKGWVQISDDLTGAQMLSFRLLGIRMKQKNGGKGADINSFPPEVRDAMSHTKAALPAKLRGLIVSPLLPSRLAGLAPEMKRHGLNVLFYPLLQNGYATFPSHTFPLNPVLRGADGWAAAVSVMKATGISVVGYLGTLSWQTVPGDHWMRSHPDWWDVDPLGRTPLKWAKTHELPRFSLFAETDATVNFVRASEPMVAARLNAFIDECAKLSGGTGLAFTDWKPAIPIPLPQADAGPPPLGYSFADRVASVRRDDPDPLDVSLFPAPFMPRDLKKTGYDEGMERVILAETDLHVTLLNALIKRAHAARPDWKTYALASLDASAFSEGNSETAKPAADVMISVMGGMGNMSANAGLLVPGSGGTMSDMMKAMSGGPEGDTMENEMPKEMADLPMVAFFNMMFTELNKPDGPLAPIGLYDVRDDPSLIDSLLEWVTPPAAAPPKKTPVTAAKGK